MMLEGDEKENVGLAYRQQANDPGISHLWGTWVCSDKNPESKTEVSPSVCLSLLVLGDIWDFRLVSHMILQPWVWEKLISNIIWSMINNLPAICNNISDTKDTKIILQASYEDAKNSSSGCAVQLFNIQFGFAGEGAPGGTGWLTLTCRFFRRFRAWNLDVTNVQWSQSWSLKVSYRNWIFNMVFYNRHLYLHNANNVSLNLLLVYSDVCSCIIVASVYWVLLF